MLCGKSPASPTLSQQIPSSSHQGRFICWLICTVIHCSFPSQGLLYQHEPTKRANPEVQLDVDYGPNHSQAEKLLLSTHQPVRMGLNDPSRFLLPLPFLWQVFSHPIRNPPPWLLQQKTGWRGLDLGLQISPACSQQSAVASSVIAENRKGFVPLCFL